jgi:hypothetical protein
VVEGVDHRMVDMAVGHRWGCFLWCQSGFATLPPVLLPEQPVVVLLLERVLVSWSSVIDEHGEQEDLRGSGHRSVIPYIHGRMELYCSSLTLPV